MGSFARSDRHDLGIGKRDYWILAAILLLALGLRLWGLNAPLWYDEIMTVQTHLNLPWDEMMQSYSMNHHYLFSLQAKGAMALFGDSIWSVRLPAVIFGLGSIAALWWLARDLAGRNIAHVSAFLLAISFHHIWFSQNARGYSELAFWCTLGMILFLRGIARPKLGIWIGYGLCLALAVFTHLTGAFFFLAQGLIWLFIAIRARLTDRVYGPVVRLPALGFLLGGVLTLVLYAPILPSVIAVTGDIAQGSASDVMQEYQSPVWTVIEAVRSGFGDLGPLLSVIALSVMVLILFGARALWQRDRIFALTVFVHIPLTMLILTAVGMRIWPRFFFADIGFLMLLIVLGVRLCTDIFARYVPLIAPRPLFGVAVIAMVLVSSGLASRNYLAPKQNLAGAYELTQRLRAPDEPVYGVGVGTDIIFNDHYGANWGVVENAAQFSTALSIPGPLYLVVTFPGRYSRAIPELAALADSGALELVNRFAGTLGDGAVIIFKRN